MKRKYERGEQFKPKGGVWYTSNFTGLSPNGWTTCNRCGSRVKTHRQLDMVWEGKRALDHLDQCKDGEGSGGSLQDPTVL